MACVPQGQRDRSSQTARSHVEQASTQQTTQLYMESNTFSQLVTNKQNKAKTSNSYSPSPILRHLRGAEHAGVAVRPGKEQPDEQHARDAHTKGEQHQSAAQPREQHAAVCVGVVKHEPGRSNVPQHPADTDELWGDGVSWLQGASWVGGMARVTALKHTSGLGNDRRHTTQWAV